MRMTGSCIGKGRMRPTRWNGNSIRPPHFLAVPSLPPPLPLSHLQSLPATFGALSRRPSRSCCWKKMKTHKTIIRLQLSGNLQIWLLFSFLLVPLPLSQCQAQLFRHTPGRQVRRESIKWSSIANALTPSLLISFGYRRIFWRRHQTASGRGTFPSHQASTKTISMITITSVNSFCLKCSFAKPIMASSFALNVNILSSMSKIMVSREELSKISAIWSKPSKKSWRLVVLADKNIWFFHSSYRWPVTSWARTTWSWKRF